MHLSVNHQILLGDFEDDSNEELDARIASSGSGSGGGDSPGSSRGNGGCIRSRPVKVIPCPRCQSMNTKFCYYNNYSVNQPRHFCRNCQRYWTVGGTLRNVPVGGGSRKKIRTRNRNDTYLLGGTPQTSPVGSLFGSGGDLLSSSACMQQLSMLPPTGGMLGFGNQTSGFAPAVPPLPYLQFALEYTQGLHPSVQKPLAGLQEVPDIQSLYDTQASQAPQVNSSIFNSSSSLMLNSGVTLPTLHAPSHSDTLPSVMAKTGLWTVAAQQLPSLNGTTQVQSSWQDKQSKPSMSSQLQHRSGYVERMNPINHMNATMFPHNVKPGSWEAALMHSRPVMNDRLVPHTSWDENQSSTHTNLSPNASSTTDDERCPSNNCFAHTYEDVSQSWVDLQASDALSFQ